MGTCIGILDKLYNLFFLKVKTTDEGEYRVVVENEHGKDEKTFMLYVSGSCLVSCLSFTFHFFFLLKNIFQAW